MRHNFGRTFMPFYVSIRNSIFCWPRKTFARLYFPNKVYCGNIFFAKLYYFTDKPDYLLLIYSFNRNPKIPNQFLFINFLKNLINTFINFHLLQLFTHLKWQWIIKNISPIDFRYNLNSNKFAQIDSLFFEKKKRKGFCRNAFFSHVI